MNLTSVTNDMHIRMHQIWHARLIDDPKQPVAADHFIDGFS